MPVTDADRQAAGKLALSCYNDLWSTEIARVILDGKRDTSDIVQAFAAHREAAERAGAQAMRERAAKVCEALEDWEQLGSDEVAACIRALPLSHVSDQERA